MDELFLVGKKMLNFENPVGLTLSDSEGSVPSDLPFASLLTCELSTEDEVTFSEVNWPDTSLIIVSLNSSVSTFGSESVDVVMHLINCFERGLNAQKLFQTDVCDSVCRSRTVAIDYNSAKDI